MTHGTVPEFYYRWYALMRRCYNPGHVAYHRYGGRGIVVCEEWKDFKSFQSWCFKTFTPGRSLDRIDNDGNYSPSNCRWSTPSDQSRNSARGTSRMIAARLAQKQATAAKHVLWCNWCQTWKKRNEFHSDRNRTRGRSSYCKPCCKSRRAKMCL